MKIFLTVLFALAIAEISNAQFPSNSNNRKSDLQAKSITQPNILLIVLDDARYDFCAPNGGPAFFQSPSINRIAYEGANFKNSFVIESICAPSRATILTGLYPQDNGVNSNLDNDTICCGLPTIATILKNAGYYTGMVGKYGMQSTPQPGYDYWCVSNTDIYTNAQWNINGTKKKIYLHKTDATTQKSLEFLHNRPANQPFLLNMWHKAPHKPLEPRTVDIGLYDNDTMPFPSNFCRYLQEYPDYIYKYHLQKPDGNTQSTDTVQDRILQTKLTYELLAGVENSVSQVLAYLDSAGIMDSTVIIFMSDNGYLSGEHFLTAKELAYEESIRIPLFIRYPAWFAANTVINNQMALNLDIAPTILDAAGIPNLYNMPGKSLRNLYSGAATRNQFYFQFNSKAGEPFIRAVRSDQYKYVKSYCTSNVEEFFDLSVDPQENINQINNSAYASLIQQYRLALDSFMLAYNDTQPDTLMPCILANTIVNISASGPVTFCNGKSVTLTANVTSGSYTYQWKKNGININNATGSSISVTTAGSYTVLITNNTGCTTISAPVKVTVNNLPGAGISYSGSTAFCTGDSIILSAPSGSNYSYQWLKYGNPIANATGITYAAKSTGKYKVTVTNTVSGCSKTTGTATSITVNNKPAATISPSGTSNICLGASLILSANTGSNLTYKWLLNNTIINGATSANYTANQAGAYNVRVYSNSGCSKLSPTTTVNLISCKNGIINSDSQVKIYPNPSKGDFTFDFSSMNNQLTSVTIYDVTGRSVHKFITDEQVYVLNGSKISSGAYTVEICGKAEKQFYQLVKLNDN